MQIRMQYTSNANRSPYSAEVTAALLRLLFEEEGSEVSDLFLLFTVGLEYRAAAEELKRIGFPIVERSEWHAGRTCVYFSLDRNLVAQELPLAILGAYDLLRRADKLPPDTPIQLSPETQITPEERKRALECLDDVGIRPGEQV